MGRPGRCGHPPTPAAPGGHRPALTQLAVTGRCDADRCCRAHAAQLWIKASSISDPPIAKRTGAPQSRRNGTPIGNRRPDHGAAAGEGCCALAAERPLLPSRHETPQSRPLSGLLRGVRQARSTALSPERTAWDCAAVPHVQSPTSSARRSGSSGGTRIVQAGGNVGSSGRRNGAAVAARFRRIDAASGDAADESHREALTTSASPTC